MGMSVGAARSGRGGRGHRRRGRHHGLMSEINVTPFVDVMLVLLIIFMVTAPLLTSSVPIDLPEAGAPATATDTKPIEVSVNKAGEIWIGDEPYEIAELVPTNCRRSPSSAMTKRILIKGDKTGRLRHGDEGHGRDQLRRLQEYRAGRPPAAGQLIWNESRPHNIGRHARSAARLRADLAVGAARRWMWPMSRRCRSTSCRSRN